jgi:hypothetical protein
VDLDDAVRDVLEVGGPPPRTRRMRVGAAGVLAVALVAAAAAVLPRLGDPSATPPAGDRRPTAGSADRLGDELPAKAKLAGLLADRDAWYQQISFEGASSSAVVLRQCTKGSSCTTAVLLTDDRWDSYVAQPLPDDVGYTWIRLTPDGAVAVVPDSGGQAFLLSPDGSTTELEVTTEPVAGGDGALLVTGPPLQDDDGQLSMQVWVLDWRGHSLRPLASQPPGLLHGGVATPSQDVVVAPTSKSAGKLGGVLLDISVSTDGGQTWQTNPGPRPGVPGSLGGATAGLHGRLAVTFVGDGATVAPFEQLFVSDNYGKTWREVRAAHHPGTIGGVAFAPDGQLFIADEMELRLWRLTADRTDLEPVRGVPPIGSLWSSRSMLATPVRGRILAVSEDGVSWRPVAPGLEEGVPETNPYQQVPAGTLLSAQEVADTLGRPGLGRAEPDRFAYFGQLHRCDDNVAPATPQRKRLLADTRGTVVGGQRVLLSRDEEAAEDVFAAVVEGISRCDVPADGPSATVISRGTFSFPDLPGAAGWRYQFDIPRKAADELAYVAVLRDGTLVSVVASVTDLGSAQDPGLDAFRALVGTAAARLHDIPR